VAHSETRQHHQLKETTQLIQTGSQQMGIHTMCFAIKLKENKTVFHIRWLTPLGGDTSTKHNRFQLTAFSYRRCCPFSKASF
jgi:hypothetical protein